MACYCSDGFRGSNTTTTYIGTRCQRAGVDMRCGILISYTCFVFIMRRYRKHTRDMCIFCLVHVPVSSNKERHNTVTVESGSPNSKGIKVRYLIQTTSKALLGGKIVQQLTQILNEETTIVMRPESNFSRLHSFFSPG